MSKCSFCQEERGKGHSRPRGLLNTRRGAFYYYCCYNQLKRGQLWRVHTPWGSAWPSNCELKLAQAGILDTLEYRIEKVLEGALGRFLDAVRPDLTPDPS